MSIRPLRFRSVRCIAMVAALAGLAAAPVMVAAPAVAGPVRAAHVGSRHLRLMADRHGEHRLLTVAQAGAKARAARRPVVASALTTPTSQTTVRPDGRATVTESLFPVRAWHDGGWHALNPDLRAGPHHTVVPAVTAGGLVLSGGGRRPLAVMDSHGRTLAVSWPDRLPVPVLSGATATYRGVLPGVNLAVTVTPLGGFSDVLIVTSAKAAADPALARLVLGASAPGLRITAVRGGGLAVAGTAKGRPLFSAPPPQMWDSAPLPAGIRTVTGPGGQVLAARSGLPADASVSGPGVGSRVWRIPVAVSRGAIILSPARSALAGPNISYPVYIDPSFEPDPVGENASNWTQVDSGFPTTSYWDESSSLQLGLCDFSGCNGLGVARSFFTLPFPSQITPSTYIDSALLYMTDRWSASCTPEAVYLYTTSAISSSTTWYNQPAFNPNHYTGSFAFQDTSGTGCPAYGNDVAWNVLSSAQGDQAGQVTSQAYGMIAGNEGNDLYWKQFYSGSANFTLSIAYHNPPIKPASLQSSPGGGCQSSASSPALIGNNDVTMYGTVGDVDNGDGDSVLNTTFHVYTAGGTSETAINVQTGNAASLVTAQTTITRATLQAWGGSSAPATYYWTASTSDTGSPVLTSPTAGPCYFQYNPLAPASVGVAFPHGTSGHIGTSVTATFKPPSSCSPTTNPCPVSYTYQAGVNVPVTVDPNNTPATGDWTGTIPITRLGQIPLTVYGTDASGNNGALPVSQTPVITGTAPASPYPDGYFTGGSYPSLINAGTAADPGLWLSPGTSNGTLGEPIDIGTIGTGINPGTDGPGDWTGAQAEQGNFLGNGVQDVLAYYPAGQHAGTAVIVGGSGAGNPLQPSNIQAIPAGTQFTDPGISGNPTTLVAAGNASEFGAGVDDIIGIIGAPGGKHGLDLFSTSSAGNCTGGGAASYGFCQPLSSQGPEATDTSWADYILAAAELPDSAHPAGDQNNIALFALNTKDGTLYETTNPNWSNATLASTTPVGTGIWTKLTVPWTTAPAQISADSTVVNGTGKTELWTISGTTATPYLVSGNSVTAESSGPATLGHPADAWPLTNNANFNAAGTCTPRSTPASTPDTITGKTATITGTFSWGCDTTFGTDLSLTAPGSYAAPPAGTIASTATALSLSLWFKTTTADGVLASVDTQPISSGPTTPNGYDPVMYIGTDGKLHGAWWPLARGVAMSSQTALNDGAWHHAVITACNGEEGLTVDGQPQATVTGTPNLSFANPTNLTFGAGYIGTGWPNERYSGQTATADYFNGQLAAITLSTPTACDLPPVAAFLMYNATTGQCVDLPGAGADPVNTQVGQYTCIDGSVDNQMWTMQYTRTLSNGVELYQFVNVKSGLCLDPPGSGADPPGTGLGIYTCISPPSSDNQEWWIQDVTGNGDYEIVNYQSGLCLDVVGWASDGSDLAPNQPLSLYYCSGTGWAGYVPGWDDHIWHFNP